MSPLVKVRLTLAIIGVIVWAFGLINDEATVRLVGIVVLALSLALRFVPRRFQRSEETGHSEER